MIELVNKKNSVKLENKKVIALDNTLTKEGYAADAKAVGDALSNIEVSGGAEQIQADFSQQDEAAVDYIKNKPCYKKVETSLTSEVVANPQLGITLLYDLNKIYKGYYQYYTLPYLTDTNSIYQMGIKCRIYMTSDYYIDTFIQAARGTLLDTVNVKVDINNTQGFYAYYITDLKALSEENKAKFPSIGIYFEATNESYLANIKNIQSVVYGYERLTKYYMPTDTVYTEDMTGYVEEALANIPTGSCGEEWEILIDDEITEEAIYRNNSFDKTKAEYILSIVLPKTEKVVNSGNCTFLGGSCFLYYQVLSSTSYPQNTTVYIKKIDDNSQLAFFSTAYSDKHSYNTAALHNDARMGTFTRNTTNGIILAGTLPAGTKIRLYGR